MLNVNNKDFELALTIKMLTIKTVNFEHISHLVLVFLLLILTR